MAATEIAFAKSFLALLDTKPTKITPDHVEDPRGYPSSSPSLPIHIRSLRNPPLDLTLASLPLATTSALDIKLAVADETGIPVEKIKLLLNKKPVPDTRSLREMVAASSSSSGGLELGVMVMGGWSGAITGKKVVDVGEGGGSGGVVEKEKGGAAGGAPVVAQGLSGREVLETEAFWGDLKGFLEQRIRDEAVAVEAVEKFRGAWGRG